MRYLRVSQIAWRLWYRVYRPKIDCSPAPTLRACDRVWCSYVEREPALVSPNKVVFLNVEADISDVSIWNDQRYAKLWLYNLHYFDDLNAKDSSIRVDWHKRIIQRWISENPVGKGNGWEPYPTSLRIVNWIKWCLSGNKPAYPMSQSLAVQARWLSKNLEFHILGNHLLANAKALCFAGLYFSGQEADRWYSLGAKILEEQLHEQVLPDGGHFELSPMYHLIVLEDLLDLVQLMRVYQRQVPPCLHDAIERMLDWSVVMRHPDGEIPFFNDSAFKGAANPLGLDQYARSLGYELNDLGMQNLICHLKNSGYLKITFGDIVLFADLAAVGPDYLPGHAHADTLSFELSLNGQRVIVNGGTSVYAESEQRQRQRETSSHNTVTIDNSDSSEVWGGFRVARRACVQNIKLNHNKPLSAQGEHDGYMRLPGSPIHRRTWLVNEKSMEILDELDGQGKHYVLLNYNFPPWICLDEQGLGEVMVFGKNNSILLRISLPTTMSVETEEYLWGHEFGVDEPAWRLRASVYCQLPTKLRTVISW
jgi:uncharacterized heparinase superfamily protein